MRTRTRVLTAIVASLLFTATTHAATLMVTLDASAGSTESTGATAAVTFMFDEVGADDRLTLELANTTPLSIGATLTAFGFELPPALCLTPVFAPGGAGSYFDTLTYDDSVSPGWLDAPGGYDVMLTSDGSYEGGNANGGPVAQASETVVLSLGDTGMSPSALRDAFFSFYMCTPDNLAIARFQQVGPNANLSDKVGGYVPEPSAIVLLGMGAFTAIRKRKYL